MKGARPFRMQLIINDPEKGGAYPWLNALTDRLRESDRAFVENLLDTYSQRFDEDQEAVLGLMLRANWKVLNLWKEDKNMSMLKEELRRLFAPELAEALQTGEQRGIELGERRGIEKGERRGVKIGDINRAKTVACNMFQRGFSAEDAAGMIGINLEEVERWYKELESGKEE